jgi:hypothetical protein
MEKRIAASCCLANSSNARIAKDVPQRAAAGNDFHAAGSGGGCKHIHPAQMNRAAVVKSQLVMAKR